MLRSVLLAAFVLIGATRAEAAIVRLTFSGQVEEITANFAVGEGAIRIGDRFEGTVTYDTAAPASPVFDSDPTLNVYQTVIDHTLRLRDYNAMWVEDTFGTVVTNDYRLCDACGEPYDGLSFPTLVLFGGALPVPFDMGAGDVFQSIGLFMFDFTAQALSSDALLAQPLLDQLTSRTFELRLFNADMQRLVMVRSRTVDVRRVPEPATLGLLGIGVLIVGARRRRAHLLRVV